MQQNFNAAVDAMIQESNGNILPQMFANNKIRDSLILEKFIEQQEDQNKQLAAKIKPKLDFYLLGNDDEQISRPEDMYIDDEYEDNISRILPDNPLTVNNSVTAKSVKDMLCLDRNSRSCPRLKRIAANWRWKQKTWGKAKTTSKTIKRRGWNDETT